MEGIYKHNKDCFDVYINDRTTTDTDEFLGKGFDKYNRPLVEINGTLHTADRNAACCLVERFINVKNEINLNEDSERYNKIASFIQ